MLVWMLPSWFPIMFWYFPPKLETPMHRKAHSGKQLWLLSRSHLTSLGGILFVDTQGNEQRAQQWAVSASHPKDKSSSPSPQVMKILICDSEIQYFLRASEGTENSWHMLIPTHPVYTWVKMNLDGIPEFPGVKDSAGSEKHHGKFSSDLCFTHLSPSSFYFFGSDNPESELTTHGMLSAVKDASFGPPNNVIFNYKRTGCGITGPPAPNYIISIVFFNIKVYFYLFVFGVKWS